MHPGHWILSGGRLDDGEFRSGGVALFACRSRDQVAGQQFGSAIDVRSAMRVTASRRYASGSSPLSLAEAIKP